ncbi:hypothetical protein [Mycolicibacterium alvei]|nr:hypothetical protein [Mycolicibacterium alvei]
MGLADRRLSVRAYHPCRCDFLGRRKLGNGVEKFIKVGRLPLRAEWRDRSRFAGDEELGELLLSLGGGPRHGAVHEELGTFLLGDEFIVLCERHVAGVKQRQRRGRYRHLGASDATADLT